MKRKLTHKLSTPEPAPFDLTELSDEQREFYEQFLVLGQAAPQSVSEAYLQQISNGQVQTVFLKHSSFNACAQSTVEGHSIGINIAVPCLLHFIFNAALRLNPVFAHVGNSEGETPYRDRNDGRSIPLCLPLELPIVEAIRLLPAVSRPLDEQRAGMATALTEIAVAFCIFHEVGHIIGGHAMYASQKFQSDNISEFNERINLHSNPDKWQQMLTSRLPFRSLSNIWPSANPLLLRQVWEREADLIATVMTMSYIVNDHAAREHFSQQLHVPNDENYFYGVFPILLFTLKILFLYLSQIPSGLSVQTVHPHPIVRATYVHNALWLTAIDDLGMDEKIIEPLLDDATDGTDQTWGQLGARIPALEGKSSGNALARIVEREIVRLERAHKRLQPKYVPYSWIPDSAWKEHGS